MLKRLAIFLLVTTVAAFSYGQSTTTFHSPTGATTGSATTTPLFGGSSTTTFTSPTGTSMGSGTTFNFDFLLP